jgi:hypothetical protein
LAKLNNLNDEFYSRTYDIDIDALYKKTQSLERDLREKVDCDLFDKELSTVKSMPISAAQPSQATNTGSNNGKTEDSKQGSA